MSVPRPVSEDADVLRIDLSQLDREPAPGDMMRIDNHLTGRRYTVLVVAVKDEETS